MRGFLEPYLNPNVMRDKTHHWVLANENLVPALAAKHYHYQFSRNAGHVDHATKLQTLPEALKYVWGALPLANPLAGGRDSGWRVADFSPHFRRPPL